jgi:hypothetical protein
MCMARRLRQMAEEHRRDRVYHALLAAAAEMEDRAHLLAEGRAPRHPDPARDEALHAPVNLLV